MSNSATEAFRVSHVIEALMNGHEITERPGEILIIDEDNRIGTCIGEIFYEKTFSELVETVKLLSDDEMARVNIFNAMNK